MTTSTYRRSGYAYTRTYQDRFASFWDAVLYFFGYDRERIRQEKNRQEREGETYLLMIFKFPLACLIVISFLFFIAIIFSGGMTIEDALIVFGIFFFATAFRYLLE
jgi:hypothetical protein